MTQLKVVLFWFSIVQSYGQYPVYATIFWYHFNKDSKQAEPILKGGLQPTDWSERIIARTLICTACTLMAPSHTKCSRNLFSHLTQMSDVPVWLLMKGSQNERIVPVWIYQGQFCYICDFYETKTLFRIHYGCILQLYKGVMEAIFCVNDVEKVKYVVDVIYHQHALTISVCWEDDVTLCWTKSQIHFFFCWTTLFFLFSLNPTENSLTLCEISSVFENWYTDFIKQYRYSYTAASCRCYLYTASLLQSRQSSSIQRIMESCS